jgi:type VI secretion system protein ImpL
LIRRFFRALWNTLKSLWVVALLITLLITLLVWLAGPYIAVADYPVLQSVTARLGTTLALVFCWGLFVALYYSRKKKKSLADPDKSAEEEKKIVSRNEFKEKADYIRDKFKAAVRTVTRSNFYGPPGRSRYSLPWYLVIGTENSGKTSLLLNSGLQFPLNEQADRHLYNLRATEHCETFFANQAMFIDTPGKYTESRSESEPNKLWLLLLKRLFSVRPARPVNGVIVCISMRELMDMDTARREHIARTVRERLSDILKLLRSIVPVYLVFTKCDAVPGFAQFFAYLARSEREQIFGCPCKGMSMESINTRDEIKSVMQTLNAQIIPKIHQERDLAARGDMFRFPQELAALGGRIEDFLHEAFGPSRYHRPVMFRGFFFTSALSAHDVLAASAREGELSFQTGFQPSLGDYAKGFFILRLLQDCVIPEARLAGADKDHKWSLRLRRYGPQLAACGFFLFAVFFLGLSFINNYARINDVDTVYKAYEEQRRMVPVPSDARAVLPELAEMEKSTEIFKPDEDSAVAYGIGLYQGDAFETATGNAYLDVLNSRLMPHLRRTAAERVELSMENIPELKSALRAYLMLCRPRHLEEDFLLGWLGRRWSESFRGDAGAQRDLARHMEYLMAKGIVPVEPNTDLLERARRAMFKVPLAELAYQQMKEEAELGGKAPFSFRASLGDAMSPFEGDTYAIPHLYTREGYEEFCVKRCPDIIMEMTGDSWIFGSSSLALSALDMDKIYKDVRAMYFRDYTQYWNNAVQALLVPAPENLAEAGRTAERLTAGVSPVVLVLRDLRANISFTKEQEDPGQVEGAVLDAAQRTAQQKASRLVGPQVSRALAGKTREELETARQRAKEEAHKDALAVRQYFLPLDSLLDTEGNAAPALKAANDAMQTAGSYFTKIVSSDNQAQRVFTALLEVADEKDDTLRKLESTAARLPSPMGGWYESVASGALKRMLFLAAQNINVAFREQVMSVFGRDLRAYYPFSPQSDADVNLESFTHFFKAGGVLDSFYDAYVRPFTSPGGGLRSIMGQTLPLSGPAIGQLQRANRVQEAFFSSGRDLGINFMLEPYALDASLKQVDLSDGNKTVSYWHGPVKGESLIWPTKGGTQAQLTLTDLRGVPTRRSARGEWSLFRILQSGIIKRQEGNTCLIEVQQNGKWAQFLIQFRNRLNPFDPSVCSFSLPASLQ